MGERSVSASARDRPVVLEGLAWMDAEALLRFEEYFAELDESQQHAICDHICYEPKALPKFARAAAFFTRYRDLTVGAFYSTPAGWKYIGYIGNVPLTKFEGAPANRCKNLGWVTIQAQHEQHFDPPRAWAARRGIRRFRLHARFHMQGFQAVRDAEVRGVCSLNLEHASSAAALGAPSRHRNCQSLRIDPRHGRGPRN